MNLLVWRALNTSKYFTGVLNLNVCIFHYEGWEGINSYLCLRKFLPLNTMIPWGFSWLVFQEVNWSSRSRYIGWECKSENLKRIFWIICLTFYKDKKTKKLYLKLKWVSGSLMNTSCRKCDKVNIDCRWWQTQLDVLLNTSLSVSPLAAPHFLLPSRISHQMWRELITNQDGRTDANTHCSSSVNPFITLPSGQTPSSLWWKPWPWHTANPRAPH